MSETKKGTKIEEEVNQIKLSTNVIVVEKELKNDKVHSKKVTGICNVPQQFANSEEGEFITCSLEQSFKYWDKGTQSCDYTIETH